MSLWNKTTAPGTTTLCTNSAKITEITSRSLRSGMVPHMTSPQKVSLTLTQEDGLSLSTTNGLLSLGSFELLPLGQQAGTWLLLTGHGEGRNFWQSRMLRRPESCGATRSVMLLMPVSLGVAAAEFGEFEQG